MTSMANIAERQRAISMVLVRRGTAMSKWLVFSSIWNVLNTSAKSFSLNTKTCSMLVSKSIISYGSIPHRPAIYWKVNL